MHKKHGGLQTWQWAAIIAGLILVYYEYEKNKASSSSSSSSLPSSSSIDTTGAIDPTTGLPYASEIGTSGYGYGGGGGVADTTGSMNSGTSLQQELTDLGAIEGLMAGLQTTAPMPVAGTTPSPVGAVTQAVTGAAKTIIPARKATTKPAGAKNPGHTVTTHPTGKKTVTSSAPHNQRQHVHVAPPSHQRATHRPARPRPTRFGGFRP